MKKAERAGNTRFKPLLQLISIGLATYFALFGMIFIGTTPQQYDIQVGMPAPFQILATKDVKDTVTTQARQDEAANNVEPSYKSVSPEVLDIVLTDLKARYDALLALHDEKTPAQMQALSDAELASINDSLAMALTRDQLAALSGTSTDTLNAIFEASLNSVRNILNATLPEGQEANAVKNIRAELIQSYDPALVNIVVEAVRGCIRPNMLIDEEITAANREKARAEVEEEMCVRGEVIVRTGEIVTLAQYTMIASLGLLKETSFDITLCVGVALLVLLMLLSICAYLFRYERKLINNPKMMLLLSLIVVSVVALSLGLRTLSSYIMPVSLGMLLIALLINVRLAIYMNFMLSFTIALLSSAGTELFSMTMFSIALMSAISGPLIAVVFSKKMLRTTTLLAGMLVGASNFLITLSVGLINSADISAVLTNALWAAGGGLISAVICIAYQPLLEWLFNLSTFSKLIELSNPNQPLLRRLLLEAPGTYHHSIIVANLAEAAAFELGANALLARVGSYYHDIGKLKRPMYFKENQMGDNPHDRTDPRVSTAILTAHTRDGAQMAQKERIPPEIIEIILQHHGDAPVMFFYDKAIKQYGDQVDISAFRYDGPRPQSREAAIVMMADTVEAAARALPNPDPEKIDTLIRKLVRGKMTDGQLDHSSLTFDDLDKVCAAFSTVLTGVFHERIEYPDVAIPPRNDFNKSDASAGGNAGHPSGQMENSAMVQPAAAASNPVQNASKPNQPEAPAHPAQHTASVSPESGPNPTAASSAAPTAATSNPSASANHPAHPAPATATPSSVPPAPNGAPPTFTHPAPATTSGAAPSAKSSAASTPAPAAAAPSSAPPAAPNGMQPAAAHLTPAATPGAAPSAKSSAASNPAPATAAPSSAPSAASNGAQPMSTNPAPATPTSAAPSAKSAAASTPNPVAANSPAQHASFSATQPNTPATQPSTLTPIPTHPAHNSPAPFPIASQSAINAQVVQNLSKQESNAQHITSSAPQKGATADEH